jgi:hypothetical protein
MKVIRLLLITGLIAGFAFCDRENDHLSSGTILGPDIRMCACCGGWYIEIDTATYEFEALPVNSTIDLQKETFPLKVKLDWQFSARVACPDKFITVLKIVKE